MDNSSDSEIIFSPGLIRESIGYYISGVLNASMDDKFFESQAMRKYIGKRRSAIGVEFNNTVSDRLKSLGWKSESDYFVTKLLRMKTPIDFGDVDVVAWDETTKKILLIECKDMQLTKTYGEIGNQIQEFLGMEVNKNRDRLRRHLDRMNFCFSNLDRLKESLSVAGKYTLHSLLIFSNNTIIQNSPRIPREQLYIGTIDDLDRPENVVSLYPDWIKNIVK